MASRRIEDLTPEMQVMYRHFESSMTDAGLEFLVTCTYRSQQEQDALYTQGRLHPGKIVTWTKHSKHAEHKAFDIAMMENGKISWEDKNYQKAGKIGESVGLIWGGEWHPPDLAHFQTA